MDELSKEERVQKLLDYLEYLERTTNTHLFEHLREAIEWQIEAIEKEED